MRLAARPAQLVSRASLQNVREQQSVSDSDPNAIETATRRLMAALEALEAAVERRREADGEEERLAERIHALGTDRSRLTNELDAMTAQARALETVNRDVAKRLDAAIGSVRAVLEDEED